MPEPSAIKEEIKVELKADPKGPIQVVATRAGFYGLVRRVEGDMFTIDGPHQLGDWMKQI